MELIGHSPDYAGLLNDKRLEARAIKISQALLTSRTSSIHASVRSEAEQKGFYRFLGNEKVTEKALIEELANRCSKNVSGRDIIVIQDTTSIGLTSHEGSIKANSGLGLVGNKIGLGFLAHPSIVLDEHNETLLGYCDVQLWHRTEDKANNTTGRYKKQPIQDKESFKWIKAGERAKQCLATARNITIIQDREGDIYEQFCLVPDDRTHLIIRSRDNRKLEDGTRLLSCLAQSPVLGSYRIPVFGDLRKEKVKRIAEVEVRCRKVGIQKPRLVTNSKLPTTLTLYAVEVKEKGQSKDRLCWRLLTTRATETFQEAIAIINKYKLRWYIEQLFRLLKTQGYKIEDSQLENGWAIRKMFVLLLNAALRVMQLYMAYENEDSQATSEVFNKEEIKCLRAIEQKYIPKTDKTINPYKQDKLAWVSWIIARLGGWKGNNKQRRAGPIIMQRGVNKFETMYQGWQLTV